MQKKKHIRFTTSHAKHETLVNIHNIIRRAQTQFSKGGMLLNFTEKLFYDVFQSFVSNI